MLLKIHMTNNQNRKIVVHFGLELLNPDKLVSTKIKFNLKLTKILEINFKLK